MDGRATAPAAGTVLNALATGRGAAFAIERTVTASVHLDGSDGVTGEVADAPGLGSDEDPDASLIERCVELAVARHGDGQGGTVRTESEVPLAAGLKSSSAAANAAVLATLDALGVVDDVDPLDACRLGVQAARDAGVTVTGAFDDASASMLGGLTVTDNAADELLARDEPSWDVLVWTPPRRAYSAAADVDRCRRIAPVAHLVADLALSGDYGVAMTVNGLAYAVALGFSAEPLMEALPHATGVSLSGTGPSVVAVGDRDDLAEVRSAWDRREGETWLTTTRATGAVPG
ncbi:shikimate kinase [Halobacteriales archaeon QS_8_69_26]|nr:MAG: shikimate kinase [Halobacteriales archaeon QS_8_69_26]